MTAYRERLFAPLSWWFGCLIAAAIFGWIVLVATTQIAGGVTFAVTLVITSLAVQKYGAVLVERDAAGLRVGQAFLEDRFVGDAIALHREDYKRKLGIEADARAYLVTRPYIDRGVLVQVNDPDDPTPYWLISSRQPDQTAAAINDPTTPQETIPRG